MSTMPPPAPQAVLMPPPVDAGEPLSVSTTYYRTDHELAFYLRAFRQFADTRWAVVLGLRAGGRVSPADMPPNVRLIMTTAGADPDPDARIGWFVPDPLRAVVVGMTGLQPGEGLMLLFPADWSGPSPDDLVDDARRWRSSPHRATDDVYFDAN